MILSHHQITNFIHKTVKQTIRSQKYINTLRKDLLNVAGVLKKTFPIFQGKNFNFRKQSRSVQM
jgi:hypothetical protein